MWSASDEALLAGLASGDADAATAFVRRYQARVFGLALTMLREREVAEEVAQETFLRAWRHAGAYDPRRSGVATWLLSITRNLAIDRLRMRRTDPVDPTEIGGRADPVWSTRDAGAVGDDVVDLREAVAALPAEQRRALLLAAMFGYTAREIGAIEGAPLGTAKTRIRTALTKVRCALGEAEP